ncbi:hypothetical protein STEG23_001142, partial [Scotinomys teguina]
SVVCMHKRHRSHPLGHRHPIGHIPKEKLMSAISSTQSSVGSFRGKCSVIVTTPRKATGNKNGAKKPYGNASLTRDDFHQVIDMVVKHANVPRFPPHNRYTLITSEKI